MSRLSILQATAALLVLALAHEAYGQVLIDQTKFGNPNATFDRLNFQSYSNLTLDACYIKDVSLASPKTPNAFEALSIYAEGKFAFRLNATTQGLSTRKRTILPFASTSYDEVWFKQYAKYYTGNETQPFLVDWINSTLAGQKYFTTSASVSNTGAKTLIMTIPIYYMFHEIDAGFRGFKTNNATTGAVAEITDGFFVFYGPKKTSCSMPVFQQKAARTLCTLNKKKVSVHLEAMEAAFVQLFKAVPLGNSTAGVAAYEAGRQSMFKAVTFSQLQLILTSVIKASKTSSLEQYRGWITEARVWLLVVEPYIFSKSPSSARRLVSILNPASFTIKKNLLAQVKAAMIPYLKASGASWKTVWAC